MATHSNGHATTADAHHGGHGAAEPLKESGQQHPLGIYFKIWGLLFVLSIASYLVDYFQFQGFLRWSLIIVFMLLKAGLIVAVFMHMVWERLALVYAIVVPPLLLLVLLGIGALEANYTNVTRAFFFGPEAAATTPAPAH
ncbi:MAG TPA: cytochrome C oxidase subunit IV family protein [Casimicrobiaceae bacterium]|nr:cytochrome C oxidase subunit IV family protein [Casimicrobiaceae bacterium]